MFEYAKSGVAGSSNPPATIAGRGPLRLIALALAIVVMLVPAMISFGCAAAGQPSAPVMPSVDATKSGATIRYNKRNDLHLASVRINGRHVGDFLIDTGASVTVVDIEVARRLGLKTVGRGRVTGIGGTEEVDIARIDSLQVDQAWFPGHDVRLVNMKEIERNLRWPVAGILGINMLGRQPFTIDYRSNRVELHAREDFTPPPGTRPFPLRMVGRIPAVLTMAGEQGSATPIWLQIDSGMNAPLAIPRTVFTANPGLLSGHRHTHQSSMGVGGAAANIRSEIGQLTIMGRTLTQTQVMLETRPPTPPFQNIPVGRVGNRLLDQTQLTFDLQRQTIHVRWLDD